MFEIREIASALGAKAHGQAYVCGVSTDSRSIKPGELFVALQGPNFDGHEFISAAFHHGASAALLSRETGSEIPYLLVKDTRSALGQLAQVWRKRCGLPVVAITGSNGKTTVKEMLSAIARAEWGNNHVLSTRGNFNNEIGLPLTLLQVRSFHRMAVLEMGMNHSGEIRYLSGIAMPDVALVNNAQNAHLEGLGTVEAVARAKGEIYEGLGSAGIAVINADDRFFPLWRQLAKPREILTFGISHGDIRARYVLEAVSSRITLLLPDNAALDVRLNVPGEHNVRNAIAATAAALAAGIGIDAIRNGLEGFAGVSGRLQIKSGQNGALLLDDSYNANPDSVRVAIDVLARQPGRKIFILGDMGELGEKTAGLHSYIGDLTRDAGIDALYTVGHYSLQALQSFKGEGKHFDDQVELVEHIRKQIDKNTTLLIKGSRFMKMERVVHALETVENVDGFRGDTCF
ncbi:MAG TPA: UDP-N-acetylmuramoyl-tripeptide--D-alanyl-D-alanine ligase [Burkholderiales bacterium]|nr:UDP-N-acetylmuramoyl-tripeptide--D-alanyl-D-alanine ligase [Burkholderiales bacterium]